MNVYTHVNMGDLAGDVENLPAVMGAASMPAPKTVSISSAIPAELAGLAGNWANLAEHIRQTIATLTRIPACRASSKCVPGWGGKKICNVGQHIPRAGQERARWVWCALQFHQIRQQRQKESQDGRLYRTRLLGESPLRHSSYRAVDV
jgi:hypothetical protein